MRFERNHASLEIIAQGIGFRRLRLAEKAHSHRSVFVIAAAISESPCPAVAESDAVLMEFMTVAELVGLKR
jgi:hypothetical protein